VRVIDCIDARTGREVCASCLDKRRDADDDDDDSIIGLIGKPNLAASPRASDEMPDASASTSSGARPSSPNSARDPRRDA
jgi:hypothetical protein